MLATGSRSMRLAALALLVLGMGGCQENNEKNFTTTPGSAPPGAPFDGEAPSQPTAKNGKPANQL